MSLHGLKAHLQGAKVPRSTFHTLIATPSAQPDFHTRIAAGSARWRITTDKASFLEPVFVRTRLPSRATIEHLAHSLAVRARQIQVWFLNRRQRLAHLKESPTSPGSPTGSVDAMRPDELESLKRKILDQAAASKDNSDDDSDDELDVSDSNSPYVGSDGDEDDAESYQTHFDGDEVARRSSTARPFNLTEAEESEAAYLHLLSASGGSLRDSLYTFGGAWTGIDWLLPSAKANGQLPNVMRPKSAHSFTHLLTQVTADETYLTPHASDLGYRSFDTSAGSAAERPPILRDAVGGEGSEQQTQQFEAGLMATRVACYFLEELLAM
ncbi:hypothetical protein T492DRAFT_836932 [Pavlovales sp. CCMP2436]|nr:hypothetical protein T492DRAFT_836932 [Pavlovales sp. CCMP2436]